MVRRRAAARRAGRSAPSRAVDRRGLEQGARNRPEERPQHVDREGQHEPDVDQDHEAERVDEIELDAEREQRDHEDDGRNHHQRDHRAEHDVAPPEVEPHEPERGHAREQHADGDRAARHDERVQQPAGNWSLSAVRKPCSVGLVGNPSGWSITAACVRNADETIT